MIFSNELQLVFIKGRKVAGTSLEVLLSALCGEQDIITPITPVDERHRVIRGKGEAKNYGAKPCDLENYLNSLKSLPNDELGELNPPSGTYFNHMPLSELEELHGDIPSSWGVYAVERCPYRKIISLANMQINFAAYLQGATAMRSDIGELKFQIEKLLKNGGAKRVRNVDLYKDRQGKMRAQALRYEALVSDVQKLMQQLNIEDYPELLHFKRGMSSNTLDLQTVFSRHQFDIVNELFEEEFRIFGYEMLD